jgi:hypothetical protein
LEPLGVLMLDTADLIKQRKEKDMNITAGFLHYCNPGNDKIPEFIITTIIHLIYICEESTNL